MPAITSGVTAGASGVGELRAEPLDPPVDRHVVDVDASLGQQFLDVPIGKAEPQVPPDGQRDDRWWEPEPDERRAVGMRRNARGCTFESLSDGDSTNATAPGWATSRSVVEGKRRETLGSVGT